MCDRPYNGRQKISEPAVVGAIIDLGLCLNLLDSRSIEMVGKAHADLEKLSKEAGISLPANSAGHPEIDAVAQPVIVIFAGLEGFLAGEYLFCQAAVAAVVAEDETGGGRVQVSTESLGEAHTI